jgi:hypothetical protein
MNGKKAKQLRKLIFNQDIFDRHSTELVALEPVAKEAAIHSAQRKLYLRAKKVYARLPQGRNTAFFDSTARVASYLNEGMLNRFKSGISKHDKEMAARELRLLEDTNE